MIAYLSGFVVRVKTDQHLQVQNTKQFKSLEDQRLSTRCQGISMDHQRS